MKYEIMLGILFDLLAKKSVTASYLAEKYEVSKRSIYRYINCIEMAGIPIYTNRGNGGGFAIVDTYKLPSSFMTITELEQTISTLSAICDGVPNKTLESAVNKLKATIKNEYAGFDVKAGNLIIDGGPWGDTVGYKSKLITLQKCIDGNLQLSIKYHDRNGDVSERVIDPYIIVFKQGLWYIFAYCHLRGDFRLFKTGRIEYAQILNTSFVRQDISKIDLPLDFWHNTTSVEEISLEIDKSCLSDIEEWLGIENVKEENGKFISSVKLPYDDGLVSKLISFGGGVKVLSPDNLKEKLMLKAKEIVSIYE
jgi:predicted DNA-binding transcriptional regulator YafY